MMRLAAEALGGSIDPTERGSDATDLEFFGCAFPFAGLQETREDWCS